MDTMQNNTIVSLYDKCEIVIKRKKPKKPVFKRV
jgi:hypothetical protein